MATHKVIDLLRKRREKIADTDAIRALRDPEAPPDEIWEKHWKQEHLKHCVEQTRGLVSDTQYNAFRMLVFNERSVPDVCTALGLNRNQVYKAKSRVLQYVREKMTELGVEESR